MMISCHPYLILDYYLCIYNTINTNESIPHFESTSTSTSTSVLKMHPQAKPHTSGPHRDVVVDRLSPRRTHLSQRQQLLSISHQMWMEALLQSFIAHTTQQSVIYTIEYNDMRTLEALTNDVIYKRDFSSLRKTNCCYFMLVRFDNCLLISERLQ